MSFISAVCLAITAYCFYLIIKANRRKQSPHQESEQVYHDEQVVVGHKVGITYRAQRPDEPEYVPPKPPWSDKYRGPLPYGRCYSRTDQLGRPATNASIFTEMHKKNKSSDPDETLESLNLLNRIYLRKAILEELAIKSPQSDEELIRAVIQSKHPRSHTVDIDLKEEIESMHKGHVLESEEGKIRGVIDSWSGVIEEESNGRNVIAKGREKFEEVEESKWLIPLQFQLPRDTLYGEYRETETGRFVIGVKPNFYDPDFRRVFFCGETGLPKTYSTEDGTLHKYTGTPEDDEAIKFATATLEYLLDTGVERD